MPMNIYERRKMATIHFLLLLRASVPAAAATEGREARSTYGTCLSNYTQHGTSNRPRRSVRRGVAAQAAPTPGLISLDLPGEHGGAPSLSPRSAQVAIHHFWTCSGQAAMADSGYPARPGRLDGRLRGGGVRRARLQLHRQGQAVRALRPPSSANIHRFHASRRDLPVVTVIIDAERKRLSNASRFSLGLGLGK